MVRELSGRIGAACAAVPAAVLGLWSLAALVQSPAGANPYWQQRPVNMTEAAALRDQGSVAALVARGEDPHLRRELPADLVLNERAELTPFEAAIALGRPEIAELLIWSGYRFDATEWRQLRCLAMFEEDDDIGALLDAHRPAGATLECAGVTRPWTR
jgi:hypothetical protein